MEPEVRLPQPGQGAKEVQERYTRKMIEERIKLLEESILFLLKEFEDETSLLVKEVDLEFGLISTIDSDPWLLQGVKTKVTNHKGEQA